MSITPGPFVLGGNVFGWTVDKTAAFSILDAFVAGGGTLVDTADLYPAWVPGNRGGESEEIVGAWLKTGARDRVQIATKVGKWGEQPGLRAKNITSAVDGSLKRLGVDVIDLYYAHEDDEKVEQREYVEAFAALVKAGKVRALGASNFTPARLTSALSLAKASSLPTFTVAQDKYNLVERDFERDLQPVLVQYGIVELPYFGLASGFLTGKYRPGVVVDSARAGGVAHYLKDTRNVQLLSVLDDVAAAHKTSVTAVSLAWLRQQQTIGAPIASARTVEQLGDLFASAAVTLSAHELQRLSSITA